MPMVITTQLKNYELSENRLFTYCFSSLRKYFKSLGISRKEILEAELRRKIRREISKEADVKMEDFKRKTLNEAKREVDKAKKETEYLLSEFDSEIQDLHEEMDSLVLEKEGLLLRIKELEKDSVSKQDVVLKKGTEQSLYDGELKDMILEVLSDALKTIPENTRKADIIADVIRGNDFQQSGNKKAELLKKTLKDYKGMTKQVRKQMNDLGFVIDDSPKHYKVTYYGDPRYMTTIGKTPSDYRAGRNNAAIICKQVF